jgi:flagellar motor component MotA
VYKNLQFFFGFMIIFGGYLFTKGTSNTNVLIFRMSLIIVGIIGTVCLFLYKKKKA